MLLISLVCVQDLCADGHAIETYPKQISHYVIFEVFTVVIMKNVVFWDVFPCGSCKNRRFGGAYRLHPQDENNQRAKNTLAIASECSKLRRINHYMKNGANNSLSHRVLPLSRI
jgi:hypothetical protein